MKTTKQATPLAVWKRYGVLATWVPFDYCYPPIDSKFEVLQANGVIINCDRAKDGNIVTVLTAMKVEYPIFWRPLKKDRVGYE